LHASAHVKKYLDTYKETKSGLGYTTANAEFLLEEKKMLTLIAELLGLDETGSALLTAYADEDEGHPRLHFHWAYRVKEARLSGHFYSDGYPRTLSAKVEKRSSGRH